MTTIIVTHEDNEVDEFEFESDLESIGIGRRSSNDVCIPNLSVSGNHARIVFENSVAWLEDRQSTNGTYINGLQITRQQIHDGDEIILGKVRLAYVGDSPSGAATHTATAAPTVAPSATVESPATVDKQSHPGNGQADSMDGETHLVKPAQQNDHAASDVSQPSVSADSDDEEASIARDASLFNQSQGEPNGAAVESAAHSTSEPAHPLDGVDRQDEAVTPMHELDSTPSASKGAVIEIKNGAKSGQILPIDKPVTTLGRPGIQIAAIMRKPDGYFLMHIESDDSVDRPTLNQDAIGDEPVLLHSGDELNVAGIDVEFMLS